MTRERFASSQRRVPHPIPAQQASAAAQQSEPRQPSAQYSSSPGPLAVWTAPQPSGPVRAHVSLPGSKSLTNRYLLAAALGEEPAVIRRPLISRDTALMAQALAAMGAGVEGDGAAIVVTPGPLRGARINVGLAGTVMRFVPPIALFARGDVVFDGDEAARTRPIAPLVRALEQLGGQIAHSTSASGQAALPMTVKGKGAVAGGTVEIDASGSSQFVSALLLAAPRMEKGLDIRHTGRRIPSAPHIAMTVDVLREAGIAVRAIDGSGRSGGLSPSVEPPPGNGSAARGGLGAEPPGSPTRWTVEPGIPRIGDVTVEPDLSNAGPFLAAAMATGGETILDWPDSRQPGSAYRELFEAMGARTRAADGRLALRGPATIGPIDADMHDVGELVPTVAAVAAFADGPSALRNIGQLRGHETDRLAALVAELTKVGAKAQIEGDDLLIEPGPPRPATIETYADHRMATFGAILGLRIPGLRVANIETTAKTFPQFVDMWEDLAAGAEDVAPAPLGDIFGHAGLKA